MLSKVPQIGVRISPSDICSGYKGIFFKQQENFIQGLSDYLSARYIFLLNSGTAAFYIILGALKELSPKKEVVLPAYTAPAVVLPILRAGLKPVLSDISLNDFNIDLNLLPGVVTKETLCVVPTHLFGTPVCGIETIKENISDVFIIQDCAQSMGSKIKEKRIESFSDVGFLSFNRGKNLPTYGGGCIFTNSSKLAGMIKTKLGKLKEQSILYKFMLPLKMMAFSLVVRPVIFGTFYPVISRFKDNQVPDSFSVGRYTHFQAGVGLSLLNKIDESAEQRYQNGMTLINGLAHVKGIKVPTIPKDSRPAFNRLPILLKDLALKDKVEAALQKASIDTSSMYLRPIHHIFDLGYKKDAFANANYFAQHLLTLPTHLLLSEDDLYKIIITIKSSC